MDAMNRKSTNQVPSYADCRLGVGLCHGGGALLVEVHHTREATKQEALVCPQCRMVKVTNVSSQPGGRYAGLRGSALEATTRGRPTNIIARAARG